MKKLLSMVISAVLLINIFAVPASPALSGAEAMSGGMFNYTEALQKSLFFYEAQQAGPLPEWNRVQWRADSTMNDFITGGLYDAGDHVKFNLPMAYTATMLAWGLYEYGDQIESSGQREIMERNLEFILDYLVACDLGDKVVYQIGDGNDDHKWWGPVEVLEYKQGVRPYYTCDASCVTGEMAAALAAGAAALEGRSAKVDEYLIHSKSLFKLADKVRSDESYTEANGFYNSWSGFWDELFWAANWLYIATNDNEYLNTATSYLPNLSRENQSSEYKYGWGMCWDDKQHGAMLLYARSTGNSEFASVVERHLDNWLKGEKDVKYTPDGLAWMDQWGCLRYATTTGFLASVWADYIDDTTKIEKYTKFYEKQINYCLGDNAAGRSYVVGFGENSPKHPHHRTAHGSYLDKDEVPDYHRHVLYGALVGGPSQDGSYEDKIDNFVNNEVANDYNAGYTALLCKMVAKYGGEALSDFPPVETPDGPEFFIGATINQQSARFTELKVWAMNHSAWPARVIQNLSYNYYFDLTEVFEAGYTVNDIEVRIGYDQYQGTENAAKISGPIHYADNIYYVKISYDDATVLRPSGQSDHRAEVQFRVGLAVEANCWDASNDYSYQDLPVNSPNLIDEFTDRMTMYDGDILIFGVEPDGKTPDVTTTATEVTTTVIETEETTSDATGSSSDTFTTAGTSSDTGTSTTSASDTATEITTETTETTGSTVTTSDADTIRHGDVNTDGYINLADVILMCKAIVGTAELNYIQSLNSDVHADGEVDVTDALKLLRYLTEFISIDELGKL